MRTLILGITQSDIDASECGNPFLCAAARAFRRALPAGVRVAVSGPRVHLNGRPYELPAAVVAWVLNYDDAWTPARAEPRPLAFAIEVEESLFWAAERGEAA